MKKTITVLMSIIMLMGICSCGSKEENTANVENFPQFSYIEFEELASENKAAAKEQFEGKQFKVSAEVARIEDDHCKVAVNTSKGGTTPITVNLATEELVTLKKGFKIDFVGTFNGSIDFPEMNDAYLLEPPAVLQNLSNEPGVADLETASLKITSGKVGMRMIYGYVPALNNYTSVSGTVIVCEYTNKSNEKRRPEDDFRIQIFQEGKEVEVETGSYEAQMKYLNTGNEFEPIGTTDTLSPVGTGTVGFYFKLVNISKPIVVKITDAYGRVLSETETVEWGRDALVD